MPVWYEREYDGPMRLLATVAFFGLFLAASLFGWASSPWEEV